MMELSEKAQRKCLIGFEKSKMYLSGQRETLFDPICRYEISKQLFFNALYSEMYIIEMMRSAKIFPSQHDRHYADETKAFYFVY